MNPSFPVMRSLNPVCGLCVQSRAIEALERAANSGSEARQVGAIYDSIFLLEIWNSVSLTPLFTNALLPNK